MTSDNPSARVTFSDWQYRDLDTPLTGVLCRDETLPGRRPGILLAHGASGLDDHPREQAERYAALGYVVFACDMFGDGVAGNRDLVIGCLTALRDDPAFMVRRARAGLAALARCPGTDASRLSASAIPGVAYDRLAADRSLADIGGFLREIFAG